MTALLSTIVFSIFIISELMEMPFRLIDKEMQHMVESLTVQSNGEARGRINLSLLPYNPDHYWIEVTDSKGNILYQSAITQYTRIPASGNKTRYMIERTIPRSQIWLGQDDHNEVLFRVRVMKTRLGSLPVKVTIAKPIEDLEKELQDLMRTIAISLAACTLLILIISYKLAGKILQPVVSITRMAKEISEDSLNKRIPLSQNRDELYDLSLSLNRMFDRLQYSFKRQKEFIGNASHELKSPITLLMLAQEEILLNHKLSETVSKALARQLNTTRRMSQLVRNLLDLSRLEQQETLTHETVNMTILIDRVLDDYSELISAKNISIDTQVTKNLVLQGDPEKLSRLLINLIDNSIRYNFEQDGIIVVKGKKKNGMILLEVSNSGKHIPEGDLDLVFEQFYRAEKSRSATHGGSGLGLTIAKKIVDIHDGVIYIANEPEGLVKVTVSLPADSQ